MRNPTPTPTARLIGVGVGFARGIEKTGVVRFGSRINPLHRLETRKFEDGLYAASTLS